MGQNSKWKRVKYQFQLNYDKIKYEIELEYEKDM